MPLPFSGLAIAPETPPMEAKLGDEIPAGPGWQFEPKWDGFRCLAFRDGDAVELMSKSGKPLGRYFPEVVEALAALRERRFVLDGELVLPVGEVLSFAALQLRLHPAASRIEKLSRETPAQLMLFDCLQLGGDVLLDKPLSKRRAALEGFLRRAAGPRLHLSPAAGDPQVAAAWFERSGEALDGVIAKRTDAPYRPGERAMIKVKQQRTADCVVGGYRTGKHGIGSLLLGLYDGVGKLDYVGYTSSFSDADRAALAELLAPYEGPSPFTGSAPGGQSRWSAGRSTEWTPLRAELVAEVTYDQVTAGRFRHGTTFRRWRPDKRPDQCTQDQLAHELSPAALEQVLAEIA
ncbi:ATP-dependent DNA ligase [Altererythrobacter soli]|uniref:DNA ligase (ATP) n=1 Tax=Croceibacterium soli TaxID=1739690 RepID=A0A6I4URM4_9SPHN|nr:ATP-dependent DNA ligase [Croceibacterium soli]MXP41451.1 ATP-dependent DNA ligase [Croceibacterium soli]